MWRHDRDTFALVTGLVLIAAAVTLLVTNGRVPLLTPDMWPFVLIGAGVVVLVLAGLATAGALRRDAGGATDAGDAHE